MKRLLISGCMFLFILIGIQAIAQEKVKDKDDKTKVKDKDANYKEKDKDDKVKIKDDNGKMKIKNDKPMLNYPYIAGYSSNFIMGNPAHAKMVLDAWKDWDDNALDRHDFMADTIAFYLPDGQVMRGKDANMIGMKKYRSSLTGSKSTIDAWVPLRSVDRKEDWVAIWGAETDTHPDGKVETTEIHEVWRINRDGKVDLIRQFAAKPAMQQ